MFQQSSSYENLHLSLLADLPLLRAENVIKTEKVYSGKIKTLEVWKGLFNLFVKLSRIIEFFFFLLYYYVSIYVMLEIITAMLSKKEISFAIIL